MENKTDYAARLKMHYISLFLNIKLNSKGIL
jgi:hypothetical protein